jgi:leucyl-tRNA synthetase
MTRPAAHGPAAQPVPPYDAASVEPKWQARWAEAGCFKVGAKATGGAGDRDRRTFFNFDGGPFPNGALHMGHVRTFTLGDVMARYQRMCGRRVLYCFEFDAFGLPNELAAEALGVTPEALTHGNIERMRRQMVRLGLSYDWDHVTVTCDLYYYRWTQWLFLKLRERGLIYRAAAELNWCPSCRTTLAHMQVEDGRCWRCESAVEQRTLTQWFVALSRYSAVLAESLERLDGFSPRVRNVLQGFIGAAPGIEIDFPLAGRPDIVLTAFLPQQPGTEPAAYGAAAAYLAVAPGHPLLETLATLPEVDRERLAAWMGAAGRERRRGGSRTVDPLDGFDTGLSVVHLETGAPLPVFVAGYVDRTFATGIEAGCPARNPRDRQFAERHKIAPPPEPGGTGMPSHGGRPATHYRVHDWLVSRQRAWGTPIPVIHCPACGEVDVPHDALPVLLPTRPADAPPGGLAVVPGFAETACPRCGGPAKRETDTLDCYFDVIWCFLACAAGEERLRDPNFAFRRADFAEWMPVDWFHNGLDSFFYMHLYRFIGHVLHDMGVLAEPEPIRRYVGHDAVLLCGRKMSKHHGNVISPDEILERTGSDVLRVHVLWAANPLKSVEWSDAGLKRAQDLLAAAWKLVAATGCARGHDARGGGDAPASPADEKRARSLDRSVDHAARRVTGFLERYQYGGCLQEIHHLVEQLARASGHLAVQPDSPCLRRAFDAGLRTLVLLLSPFAPHIAEEMWERSGGEGLATTAPWPATAATDARRPVPKAAARRAAAPEPLPA